ncbi:MULTISPECIES: acyl-CoA dehydrogenase family protein [Bradyrhizobium]|uniref:acyl-CoA dehydrogenase family protein n=1 Tax=Bradyrhizobium TaxID=374 RepID=UPI0027153173|nr:acyl-CoA dehydrogenase [Bradyrhizobium elkanii]WLA48060.1 acyl-CoA dehydrogenase [Bradyrhizobium elkanii]WLB81742.1 acyl-CoA dehydrogenase [Bradyrhizobium elkanii]
MALVLTEEQSMLRDSARGLISDKAPVAHLRSLRDAKDATGFSRDLWKTFAEMGFSGLLVPDQFGGSGLGCVEAGIVMEEIGRTLMPSPFLATSVLAASALSRGGSEAQKAQHLPKIADGSLLAALAIDEGAKHRPLQTKLQATRSGNGFKLSGDKAFVVDGHTADLLIVAARTAGSAGDKNGLTLFLVDPKAKGLAVERTAMVDSHNAARIVFDNVEVNADSVLGEVDQGFGLLEGVLNIGRGAVASEMVGLSDEVFGRTVAYLKERKQFGKAIGEFQALQHRAAQLYIDIEITRAAVLKALQALDTDADKAATAVAVAKARAGTTATLAVQEGVQMHGGMGMTDQFDIGFFMKRARVCQELFGDSNFHTDQLASGKGY